MNATLLLAPTYLGHKLSVQCYEFCLHTMIFMWLMQTLPVNSVAHLNEKKLITLLNTCTTSLLLIVLTKYLIWILPTDLLVFSNEFRTLSNSISSTRKQDLLSKIPHKWGYNITWIVPVTLNIQKYPESLKALYCMVGRVGCWLLIGHW